MAGGGGDGHAAGLSPRWRREGETALGLDPYAGHLFVVRGRQGDLIKVIWLIGQGSCLFAKRLEKGRLVWPAASEGKVAMTPARAARCSSRASTGGRRAARDAR